MTPILIDSGKSERGWSFYGSFEVCLHYGALVNFDARNDTAPPLVRGTLGHVAQAHLHARWQAQQMKVSPDVFYEPEAAMEEWCRRNPEGVEHFDLMREVFRRYLAKRPEPPGRIIAVEHPIKAVFGTLGDQWGLWVVHPQWADWLTRAWRTGDPKPHAVVGGEIAISPLNVPGHPDHGGPVFLTRRLDLIVERRSGAVDIVDHKHKASVTGKTALQYAMDGQFAAARIFGHQLYGKRFGRCTVNSIQTAAPWTNREDPIPESPWRDGQFARNRFRRAHEIAQLQVEYPNPHDWPMAEHEQVCVRRYGGGEGGTCSFTDLCRFGPKGA